MKKKSRLFLTLSFFFLILSSVSYAQYVSNYAFSFNGSSSHIAIPNDAELNPTTATTMEAWIYPKISQCATIIGKNYTTNYWLGLCNTLRFYAKGSSSVTSPTVIPLNKWTHVAVTYDGATTKFYINGQLDYSAAPSITGAMVSNSDSLFIGGDVTGFYFNGYIDNVRIWNVTRTQAQIQNTMYIPLQVKNPTGNYAGLVGAWLLDWDASDRSGATNNNGILRNVSNVYLENKPMNHYDFNNALLLDGFSYAAAPNENDFNATTAITVEAWIKRNLAAPQPEAQNIVQKGHNSNFDYALFFSTTGSRLYFETNTGSGIIISSPLNAIIDEAWHHVAATYNSTDGKAVLYIDGKLVSQNTTAGNPTINNTTSDSLFMGGSFPVGSGAGYKFNGLIDEVRVWKNVARTEAQIKATMYGSRKDTDGASESCAFSFDEKTNMMQSNGSGTSNGFAFRGNALITSSKLQNRYSSPIISTVATNILTEFVMSTNRTTITSGTTVDSVYFPGTGNLTVTDVKAVVLLNHGAIGSVRLSLVSPDGTVVNLTPTTSILNTSHDLMTIFDPSADSTINYTNAGLAPFSPKVKPFDYNFFAFGGKAAAGWWKLRITDVSSGPMLRVLNGWGIRLSTFNTPQYTVSTSSNPTVGGSTSGGGTFLQGTQVTVSATSNTNYGFVNWTEGSNSVSTNSSYTFVLNANRTLVANFSLWQYTITVSANPTAGGTVSGGGTYNSGQIIAVTASPNSGYTFVNWTEGSNAVSTSPTYNFTVSANRTLVANFALIPVLLVSPDFRSVTMTAGTTTFAVSNTTGGTMNWAAVSNVSWATITSGSSGTNTGTINVSYQANTGAARVAVITVTATGATGSPKTVEVRQAQFVDVRDLDLGIPETFVISQNYPNPFNPSTIIRYGLPKESFVKITVYDIIGREIAVLVNRLQNAGYHEATFDTQSISGGLPAAIYFYKISAGDFTQIKKMMLIK